LYDTYPQYLKSHFINENVIKEIFKSSQVEIKDIKEVTEVNIDNNKDNKEKDVDDEEIVDNNSKNFILQESPIKEGHHMFDDDATVVINDIDREKQNNEGIANNKDIANNEDNNINKGIAINEDNDNNEVNDINSGRFNQPKDDLQRPQNITITNTDTNKAHSHLITLNYISVCQYCKENFNAEKNIPYLLKCGHFFCKSCIVSNFTNSKNQIQCPEDGTKVDSLNSLKILHNLITDGNTIDSTRNINNVNNINNINKVNSYNTKNSNNNVGTSTTSNTEFCKSHPTQKLTHFIEETNQLVCVHCAFSLYKQNTFIEIREVSEKCLEDINNIGKIVLDNNDFLKVISESMIEITNKKSEEEIKVNNMYDSIISFLEERKKDTLAGINTNYLQATKKLLEKQNFIESQIELADKLKEAYTINMKSTTQANFQNLNDKYKKFITDLNSICGSLDVNESLFFHDDTNKLIRHISNHSDLKTKQTFISFIPKHYSIKNRLSASNNHKEREYNNYIGYNTTINMTNNKNDDYNDNYNLQGGFK